MKSMRLLALIVALPILCNGQGKVVTQNQQYWIGYMTSTRISERYYWWNDFHYVPESFAVIRTGLTRNLNKAVSATGGYAYLWLPLKTGSTPLRRHEHRPWGQIQFNLPLADSWSISQRLRYDARFKENVSGGEVTGGYTFAHRARFMVSVKKTLGNTKEEKRIVPYVAVANEILLNFGREVTYNTFDQNRLSIFAGVQCGQAQYQLGWMNRFVQTSADRFTLNHTVVLWVTQKFDLRHPTDETLHHN